MSGIAHYPAVQQINFYVNEASPVLISERRVYLEKNLLPCWKQRLEEIQSWTVKTETDLELLAAYQSGVDFLTDALKQELTA